MGSHQNFLKAIEDKVLVEVTFKSQRKGIIRRKCVPYDFGPLKRQNIMDQSDRYHFRDLDSPDGPHTLSKKPDEVLTITLTAESFNPADHIGADWAVPYNWFIARDWGQFS